MSQVPYLTAEYPLRFAHRASRILWPENTWYGFDAAVGELGYRYVETDVQVTRDGVVIVFHDETLERTTNGVGKVADWVWEDLANLDVGYHFSPDGESFPLRGTGIRIHRLDDTFDRYPDTYFNIDLKAKGTAWGVAEIVNRMNRYETVMIGSFSDRRLARFRRIMKGAVATSAGPQAAMSMYAASRLGRTVHLAPNAYQVPPLVRGAAVDTRMVKAVHEAGAHIHVWTINEPEEMHRLLDLGVDGIVSDRPDLLNEVVRERSDARG
jgi:glycerophosphoryl diester phosphodiesterase